MTASSSFTDHKAKNFPLPTKSRRHSGRKRVRLSELAPMEKLIAARMAGEGDSISHHEAEFARRQARKWSDQLFDPRSAARWLEIRPMTPELAFWCAQNGITPEIMQLAYEPDDLWHGTLAEAVIYREITREQLQDYLIGLVQDGRIPPPEPPAGAMSTALALPEQAYRIAGHTPVPPVVFRAPSSSSATDSESPAGKRRKP